ncbi:UDP-N-acetylglucosamine transporter [Caerostris extrusa]|uniref:UDP-N-acetylglucosamine transporter n=1 Tax=Caerostris extrusa TaxID=172846 RepID=A0AAV4SZE1_CAEEX|nr:UDP-N-acetylglucosamine transporter [Caerostris extrusa]
MKKTRPLTSEEVELINQQKPRMNCKSNKSPATQLLTPHCIKEWINMRPFMSPRYPGGPRPGVRMPQQVEFNPPGGVPGQPMIPNSMDPTRQGDGGEFVGWQGPPGMNPMNPRMNAPRGQPLPMNPGLVVSLRRRYAGDADGFAEKLKGLIHPTFTFN